MAHVRTWLIDLDGVIWLSGDPIAGGERAIDLLHERGIRAAFFTNNSYPRRSELVAQLKTGGIVCAEEDLLSSPDAAAQLCEPGEKVLVVGGDGVIEALERREVVIRRVREVNDDEHFDALVVGIDPKFDYATLRRAADAIRSGARFIATNDDATFPTPNGLVPGAGSLIAAIAVTTSTTPTIAGKPHHAAAQLIEERLGAVDVVVGDRPSTDGRMATAIGARFALVRSGVTLPDETVDPAPDYDSADIVTLVEKIVAAGEL